MNDHKAGLLIIALTLAMGSFHAVARGPGGTPSPQVEQVEVDVAQSQLHLKGNFFKPNGTVILLGDHRLEIKESSLTRVVAILPPNLHPATYRLLVSASPTYVNAASMYLQIPHKPTSTAAISGN